MPTLPHRRRRGDEEEEILICHLKVTKWDSFSFFTATKVIAITSIVAPDQRHDEQLGVGQWN